MQEMKQVSDTGPGRLYLVATPIGNLGDLSARAEEVLAAADFVAAEDTRVSLKILNRLGLRKPMMSYHRHNCDTAGDEIIRRVLDGQDCALMTDAGTPAVSDPGEDLVRRCVEEGIEVTAVPGPCALITALEVSGLPTGRFTFEGFLPTNRKNRRAQLESLRGETRTMIFYEAPHKLRATLDDLAENFGDDRRAALCRELTKIHEEVIRTTLGEARALYAEREPKGEYVLVVEGEAPETAGEMSPEGALVQVRKLRQQGVSMGDAVKTAARETGISKNRLYELALDDEDGGERAEKGEPT
ncbi:MAG: 16S rRNA (cytidine(1402)-2'-O)-methyltransferase [Oscillospiraceae bacterium]|nr:16S rRNA (cytidine(1402)-2'-O)-methyltransferase [Oscillospiraceae bacterium]